MPRPSRAGSALPPSMPVQPGAAPGPTPPGAAGALQQAEVVHQLPGRVRLRAPALRGDEAGLMLWARALQRLPGVHSVTVRVHTGSALLLHDGPWEAIAARACRLGDAAASASANASANASTGPETPPPQALQPGDWFGMGSIGMAMLALRQFGVGHALPPALTLLWYAASLLRHSGWPAPALGGAEAGRADQPRNVRS